jgi:small subunit ribosomal protein S16
MAVTIRLRRIGRKKQPSYRVVVTDSANARDGAYLDTVGFYNPRQKPAELRLDLEKVDTWVGKGAGLSDTVASLVRKARRGGDDTVALRPLSGEHERPKVAVHEPEAAKPAKRGRKTASAAAETEPQTPLPEAAEAFDPGTPRGEAGIADAEV